MKPSRPSFSCATAKTISSLITFWWVAVSRAGPQTECVGKSRNKAESGKMQKKNPNMEKKACMPNRRFGG